MTLDEEETRRVDFSLSSTTVQQEEVVVTGTRETYVKESPVKVSVGFARNAPLWQQPMRRAALRASVPFYTLVVLLVR